jgi:CubicO group peptidase (beta-lactamase class C family)
MVFVYYQINAAGGIKMKTTPLKLFVILLILSLPVGPAWGSDAAKDPVSPVHGLDNRALSAYIVKKMNQWHVPGFAIAIVKDGKIIFCQGFGFRDVEKKLPVTPQTIFAVGSTTKAFTAVAASMLVDDGKLDWDKPVREYLPFFKLKDTAASNSVTIRDFLCHRSGLPRHDAVWVNSTATRVQLLERMRHLEPSRDFRAAFQYQNLTYMAAGEYSVHPIIACKFF